MMRIDMKVVKLKHEMLWKFNLHSRVRFQFVKTSAVIIIRAVYGASFDSLLQIHGSRPVKSR